jgi:hypothetical protein
LDEDGKLKDEFRKTTFEDIWNLKYGGQERSTVNGEAVDDQKRKISGSQSAGNMKAAPQNDGDPLQLVSGEENGELYFDRNTEQWQADSSEYENEMELPGREPDKQHNPIVPSPDMFFDYVTMRWKPVERKNETSLVTSAAVMSLKESIQSSDSESDEDGNDLSSSDSDSDNDSTADFVNNDDEIYFDHKERRWKSRAQTHLTEFESNELLSHKESRKAQSDEDGAVSLVAPLRTENIRRAYCTLPVMRHHATHVTHFAFAGSTRGNMDLKRKRSSLLATFPSIC